jgi:hypothetical protein
MPIKTHNRFSVLEDEESVDNPSIWIDFSDGFSKKYHLSDIKMVEKHHMQYTITLKDKSTFYGKFIVLGKDLNTYTKAWRYSDTYHINNNKRQIIDYDLQEACDIIMQFVNAENTKFDCDGRYEWYWYVD